MMIYQSDIAMTFARIGGASNNVRLHFGYSVPSIIPVDPTVMTFPITELLRF